MSTTGIKRKAEDAVTALLSAEGGAAVAAMTAYKGLSGDELSCPRLQVICHTAEVQRYGGVYTGNYALSLDVYVVSNIGDTGRGIHGERCEAVEEVLARDNVEEALTSSSFTAHPGRFFLVSSKDSASDSEVWTQFSCEMWATHTVPTDIYSSSSSSSSG